MRIRVSDLDRLYAVCRMDVSVNNCSDWWQKSTESRERCKRCAAARASHFCIESVGGASRDFALNSTVCDSHSCHFGTVYMAVRDGAAR